LEGSAGSIYFLEVLEVLKLAEQKVGRIREIEKSEGFGKRKGWNQTNGFSRSSTEAVLKFFGK
jgi:hypothetical protein